MPKNRARSTDGTIISLYWDVSVARIDGVLHHISTTLVRLARGTGPCDAKP
jgi:hypothetical protein